jgi:transportin-3
MLEWKDVLQHVVSVLGHKSGDCILEFLSVLPEEVTEGRKISLSVCMVNLLLAYAELLNDLFCL